MRRRPPAGRLRPRRTAALAVLLAALSMGAADPSPTPIAPEAPLRVSVSELLPRSPQPQDAVEVAGTLRNVGSTAITDLQVRLRVGSPVRTRGGLHDADTDRPVTGSRLATATPPSVRTLAPGASTSFRIRTSVRSLGLSELGVYPLDVEARGNAGDGFQALGLAPTWVPYFAGLHPQPTRVAVVWPLVDRPHQDVSGAFRDDALRTALSEQGRLGRLLAAGAAAAVPQCDRVLAPLTRPAPGTTPAPVVRRCEPVPVTFAVDPDLLLAAQALGGRHEVRRDGRLKREDRVPAAASWLATLARAVDGSALIALPYADPDVTAMTRTDRPQTSAALRDDLSLGAVLSRSAVAETLHVAPLQSVAWPPAGVVTPAAVDVLSRGGARALVLDSSAYDPPESEPNRAPSARTALPSTTGTALEGLVADPYLSDLVTGATYQDLGPRLAEQRFLAETAIVAAEAPSRSRTLVIAPERRAQVSVAAASQALRDLGRVPWLCPVTLASVAEHSERCLGRPDAVSPAPEDRGTLRSSRDGELGPRYLSAVAEQRGRAVQLADAVLVDDPPDPAVTAMRAGLRRAVARAESSAWREDAGAASTALAGLREDLDRLIGQVQVQGGKVLLTSTSGQIQVNLRNRLPVPISVRVRFSSRTLGLVTTQSELIRVEAQHAVQVSARATAQRSGQFFVDAHLVDRDGKDFGAPTVVKGRSTRYGRLALALTIGAAGVLLMAAAFRLVRRATHRTP